MKVTIIGTGYVGLIVGIGFADIGHEVCCLDTDSRKVETLKQGYCPIYEPGAEELLRRNVKAGRISFTTDAEVAIHHGEAIFIAVGTPSDDKGDVDMHYFYQAVDQIIEFMNDYKIIIDKSTVPVGTAEIVRERIYRKLQEQNRTITYDVVSNPEFLREGKAMGDFLNPDRIVLGVACDRAKEKMLELYHAFARSTKSIITTTPETAEMIKYASNAFLATKITFINEIANLCDKVGANVLEVASAMGKDGRISPKFLHAGPGYGGSCFPKDTKGLQAIANKNGVSMKVIGSVIEANEYQKHYAARKVIDAMPNGGTIAVLGLAFKPETDDMREAPSITVLEELLATKKFTIKAYDPEAMENAKQMFKDADIIWGTSTLNTLENVTAVVILTEWMEFRGLSNRQLAHIMPNGKVFDFRHIFERKKIEEVGLEYYGMGF